MNLKDQKIRTKVLIGATGVLALAGLGIGAANAATPVTPQTATQTTTADTTTPDDPADVNGATDETSTPDDPADNASDSGTDVQQNGDHTDPGDAPGSP
jgi:hypothetical protein